MTDSTPDDKNLADEAEATEEAVQDEAVETTDDATEEVAAPAKKVSAAKKKTRPAPPADDEDDELEDEDEAPVRRRPRPAARPAARTAAARSGAGATVTTVVVTVVILALLAASITFGVLWGMQKSDNDEMKAVAADKAQAEKVAAEYATGASTFDYRDLGPWRVALVKGVSPELKSRMDAAAGALNQLLQPLQWVSKGTVLDAVVNSQSGSVYKVNAYIKIEATNVQAASGREVVTVYNVTLDKSKDWQITDVGGSLAQVSDQAAQPTNPAAPAAPAEGAQTPAPTPGG